MITTIEEYEYCLSRGYDPLVDERFPMSHDLRTKIQRERFGKNTQEADQRFYKYCLTHKLLVCEECGKPILHPGAINCSHILSRGAFPEMAFDARNVNILCAEHHAIWENGDRKRMQIYWKNNKTIQKLKKEYGTK